MRKWYALVALILAAGAAPVQAVSGPAAPLLMQRPTVSKTHIVFSYADDLWIVPREGGEAKRLTSGPGVETDPHFSPDGKWVAFTGQYEGNDDVFVISAEGGEARRLTYHPGNDQVVGWTPDSKRVLFRSSRDSYSRFTRLFTVGLDGGLPEAVPLPIADQGCFSPDGKKMAYAPFFNGSRAIGFNVAWKHYRGGRQPAIWIADLSDSSVEKLPRTDSNDTCPMWVKGGQIYFLSDRDGPNTLFVYDPAARSAKKVVPTSRDDFDIHTASAGPDCIVFDRPGEIHLFDLETQKTKKVDITIKSELPALRPRWVKVQNRIGGAGLSPTGARAVFEARGEIFTVPASKGEIRNITRSSAVNDRYPAWSPDGKSIAYLSDESGEYEIHIRSQDGKGEVKKIKPGDGPSFYYQPVWSPDSKKLAYTDKRLNLWITDVETGKATKVDTNPTSGGRIGSPAWAPDSKWLAYTKELKNYLYAVFLYNVETARSSQLSDGMADAGTVAFDRGGKYLYFSASTNVGPARGSLMSSIGRSSSSNVYLVVLNESDPSPLGPESDEDKGEADRGTEMKKKGEMGKQAPVKVKIDLTDIDLRVLSLPVPAGRYGAIVPGKAGTMFLVTMPDIGTMRRAGPGGAGVTVSRFDLKTRRSESVLSGVSNFTVSFNGDKMLYRQGNRWTIASTSGPAATQPQTPLAGMGGGGGRGRRGGGAPRPTPTATEPGVLNLENMEVKVDPRAEWRQIYNEVWRIQRDFMYDPSYHGLNIREAAKKYERFLPGVASRTDLSYLFEEMLGHLALGHLRTGGGDRQTVSGPSNGLLGADYKIENGRYRIARIYRGESWNPQLRAPLTQPGNRVKEGEYILAIDDEELKGTDCIDRLLEAKAGKVVILKVGPNPDGKDAREVKVTPTASEQQLRHYAWVTDNRARVDKATDGKVAYIYMPDTSFGGQARFDREFYAQVGKEGVILDERFNGGGWLADSIIEALSRKVLNFSASREGADVVFPRGIFGPKVMIINEAAGSGGDYMPYIFRQQKVGPLVGKKTWGGLVGVGGYPSLIDGGNITAPHWAIWFAKAGSERGQWAVENIGVSPDVEVELDPKAWREGRDPQLERAIQVVVEEMKKNPLKLPKRPDYPNYHKDNKEGRK
jgi:tricorn protease